MSHTSRRFVLLVLAAGALSALPVEIVRAPEPTAMCGSDGLQSLGCGRTLGARLMTAAAAALARTGKPVELGAEPVDVTLAPLQASLAAQIQERPERKLSLVLYGLGAKRQPGATYNVYLGLPRGAKPAAGDVHYVGSFNFFAALGARPAAKQEPTSPAFSFDVTDAVQRLFVRKLLGDGINVTIVPSNAPEKDARPSVAAIALEAE